MSLSTASICAFAVEMAVAKFFRRRQTQFTIRKSREMRFIDEYAQFQRRWAYAGGCVREECLQSLTHMKSYALIVKWDEIMASAPISIARPQFFRWRRSDGRVSMVDRRSIGHVWLVGLNRAAHRSL
jgi:hypothetical protein